MTMTALNNALRNSTLADLITFLGEKYNVDALSISSSAIVFPTVDAEGNEKYVKITVSVPRGSRDGKGGYEEFDGYAAAEDYRMDVEEKAAKKAATEAKKEAKRKAADAKREAKTTVKNLNTKGLEQMIHEEDNPNQYLNREVAV